MKKKLSICVVIRVIMFKYTKHDETVLVGGGLLCASYLVIYETSLKLLRGNGAHVCFLGQMGLIQ